MKPQDEESDPNSEDNNDDLWNDGPDFNFKFILVGESRVGKTSVTQRYIRDNFEENQ